jgi:hypothetical protein
MNPGFSDVETVMEEMYPVQGNYFESTKADAANSIGFYSWEVGESGHSMDTLYFHVNATTASQVSSDAFPRLNRPINKTVVGVHKSSAGLSFALGEEQSGERSFPGLNAWRDRLKLRNRCEKVPQHSRLRATF